MALSRIATAVGGLLLSRGGRRFAGRHAGKLALGTLAFELWQQHRNRATPQAAGGGAVLIRALNIGVDYHFAVEAFGETGVSPLTAVLAAPAGRTATVRAPDPAPVETPTPTPTPTAPVSDSK